MEPLWHSDSLLGPLFWREAVKTWTRPSSSAKVNYVWGFLSKPPTHIHGQGTLYMCIMVMKSVEEQIVEMRMVFSLKYLLYQLLTKQKNRIRKTIILPVTFYGYETRSLSFRTNVNYMCLKTEGTE
jgi:hypothetical protein